MIEMDETDALARHVNRLMSHNHHNANTTAGAPIQSNNGISSAGNGAVLSLDKQHLTWSRVTLPPGSAVPPPRSGAASVVVKGRLYMFGVSSFSRALLTWFDSSNAFGAGVQPFSP